MNVSLQNQHIRMRIKTLASSFSEKEKKIADFILQQPEKIIHGTINQVASEMDLADSTVFRFCKRLGYNGFQDMKIALASEQSNEMNQIHERISKSDDEKTVLEKIFQSNIQTLVDTLELMDEDRFSLAVEKIIASNKIEFFGFGGSNAVAMDAYHKFIRTGLPVNYQVDSHLQLMASSQLKEGDVAILISHTGHTKEVIEILDTLTENGVYTIGITGFAKSPLNHGVNLALNTVSEETDFRSEALASRIAQLTILDALYVSLMMKLGDQATNALDTIRRAIQKKRI